jgi:hypothetical protein
MHPESMHPTSNFMHPLIPLSGNAPYFSILLCLMPDDFTRHVESVATRVVITNASRHLEFYI